MLQLLDFLPTLFQQLHDTIRTGEAQRTGYNRGRFAAFQFGLNPRHPFGVSFVNKTRCDRRRIFPKLCVPGPKCSRVAFSPRLMHPVKLSRVILGMSQGIKQNDFTIAIRQVVESVYPIRDRLSLFSSFRHGRGNYPNHETSRYCCKCSCRRVSPCECTDHPDLR